MSVQIFLLGRLIGAEDFLLAPAVDEPARTLLGRATWLNLYAEVLPRALLAELGLAKILLGTSGGEQFLVLLPGESRPQADEFLSAAAADVAAMTRGAMSLVWAATENLGDWTVVRKRLIEDLQRRLGATAAAPNSDMFVPFVEPPADDTYFTTEAL